jgi:Ribonuclease G/E
MRTCETLKVDRNITTMRYVDKYKGKNLTDIHLSSETSVQKKGNIYQKLLPLNEMIKENRL